MFLCADRLATENRLPVTAAAHNLSLTGLGRRGNQMKLQDITGQKFGRLLVIERAPSKNKRTMWFCECDCGTIKDFEAFNLKNGNSTSCGCYHRELSSQIYSKLTLKHGATNSREYRSWNHMIDRCTNPNSHAWKHYGGRGIQVCERWRNSFADFLADMGPRPEATSLDRIDTNGDYEPNNCRWADAKTQGANRRGTRAYA